MWCGIAEARYHWLAVGELEGLKAAVSLVKETAQELLAATNPADAPMLTLSLREVTSVPGLFIPHATQIPLQIAQAVVTTFGTPLDPNFQLKQFQNLVCCSAGPRQSSKAVRATE